MHRSGRHSEKRGFVGLGHARQDFLVERGSRFLFPTRGHARAFIGVLGVACRATGLLDVFLDHGDNRVIGYASLAWTVVVQNVAQTQPALLHSVLPVFLCGVAGKRSRRCPESNRGNLASAILYAQRL